MTVLLATPYQGFPAGTIVTLPAETEAALIAQRIGTNNAGPGTTGNQVTTNQPNQSIPILKGDVVAAAGASSVTVSNPAITTSSVCDGIINQATADGTATFIPRTSVAAGVATLYFNAATTGVVTVGYFIYN